MAESTKKKPLTQKSFSQKLNYLTTKTDLEDLNFLNLFCRLIEQFADYVKNNNAGSPKFFAKEEYWTQIISRTDSLILENQNYSHFSLKCRKTAAALEQFLDFNGKKVKKKLKVRDHPFKEALRMLSRNPKTEEQELLNPVRSFRCPQHPKMNKFYSKSALHRHMEKFHKDLFYIEQEEESIGSQDDDDDISDQESITSQDEGNQQVAMENFPDNDISDNISAIRGNSNLETAIWEATIRRHLTSEDHSTYLENDHS